MARKKKSKKPKKTVDEKISEALDVVVADATPSPATEVVGGEVIDTDIVVAKQQPLALGYPTPGENPDIESDYETTRKHLEAVKEQAEDALDKMKEVAEQSEQARSYEVVGQLIKANLEVAEAKIKLHKDMKALREQEAGSNQRAAHIGDVNNALYVGTTKELLELKKQGKLPKANGAE